MHRHSEILCVYIYTYRVTHTSIQSIRNCIHMYIYTQRFIHVVKRHPEVPAGWGPFGELTAFPRPLRGRARWERQVCVPRPSKGPGKK